MSLPLLPQSPTLSLNKTLLLFSPPLLKHFSSPPILPFKFKSLVSHCSNSNSSHSDREEQRWLREEQRWLREEQRWLREEQRWARERDSLLREISDLKLQIEALERRILNQDLSSSSASDAVAKVTALLQVLKEKNSSDLVLESGSSMRRMVLEEKEEVVETEKEVVVVEEAGRVEKKNALRKGSEGEEVREMQEALLKLGFYSGEEDMEYSSFSSGTERAVKTWQAALGAPEDGIMTAKLLEKLYLEIRTKDTGNANENKNSTTVLPKDWSSGRVIGVGCESHGLYQLSTYSCVFFVTDSPFTIHAQLGHPTLANLQRMMPSLSKLSSLSCESCQFGKHTRS